MDDRAGAVRGERLRELRAGEVGVEQQQVRAEARGGQHRLDEPAVVAAHHGERALRPDPVLGAQAGRDPLGARVELGERERAALVDHGQPVRVARGADGAAGGGAEAERARGAERAQQAVGRQRPHDAGAVQGAQRRRRQDGERARLREPRGEAHRVKRCR